MSDNSSGNNDAPVDLIWMRECTDGDSDAMKELFATFFSNTSTLLADLDKAVATGNAAEIRRVGHACAGSSGICGMVKLEPLFRQLERMGTSGALEGANQVAAAVHSEFIKAKAFVDAMDAK